MKKYDNYKDSGIEWIGEIPSHWESWKINHAFNRIGSGTTPESGNPIYHENGTINWLNTGDLNDSVLDFCSKKITVKALENYTSLKLFPAGSLVIAMYGATIGKTAILNFETTTNQACCVFCENRIIDLKFLQYWFIGNKEQIINLAIGGGQPNISQNILKDIRVWCPNYSEQIKLTQFLDHKTSQIDDLIAKKEALIQLLEEERVAIINNAVTKGLDPNVPMKDSGIDWLGEIPEHWEIMRLRNIVDTVKTGSTPPSDEIQFFEPQEINWYGPGDFENLILREAKRKISHLAIKENKCRLFPANSILLIGIGATVGKVGLITEPSSSNQQINAIILKEFYNPRFYIFFIASIKEIIIMEASSATLPIFNQTQTKNIIIPVPPNEEQNQIVEFIQNQTERIQSIISKTQLEMELLKEYKTGLISEVVTGKLDVRGKTETIIQCHGV